MTSESANPQELPAHDPSGAPDPVAALSHIQDDVEEKLEARQWATEEMLAGRTPEDLVTTMIEQGWDHEFAEEIVETVRKETRYERGILTRDDVVRDLNVDFSRATSGLRLAFRGGLFGLFGSLFGFARGFLAAMRTHARLKQIARKK